MRAKYKRLLAINKNQKARFGALLFQKIQSFNRYFLKEQKYPFLASIIGQGNQLFRQLQTCLSNSFSDFGAANPSKSAARSADSPKRGNNNFPSGRLNVITPNRAA
jgi:hypothetical protein